MASAPKGVAAATDLDVMDTDIRVELVSRVRSEIAAGTYDTPEKWEIALGRLFDRLTAD
jgi:hypothetical protein